MITTTVAVIIAVVCVGLGIVLGKFIFAKDTKQQILEAENQAKTIVKEAELTA